MEKHNKKKRLTEKMNKMGSRKWKKDKTLRENMDTNIGKDEN